MEEILFWKTWKKEDKSFMFTLLALLFSSIAAFVYFQSQGLFNVLSWETHTETDNITIAFDQFSRYMMDFSIETENFLVSQYFEPSSYTVNTLLGNSYFYLLCFLGAIALSFISQLKKIIWFSGFMTFFIAWIALLHLDTLGIFGYYGKLVVVGTIFFFLAPAFYFHTFKTNTPTALRFTVFIILFGVFLYIVNNHSELPNPTLFLAANSYIVATVLSILFITAVSHDIITLFLFLNAKAKSFNPKNNVINFAAITSIYLISPIILVLQDINVIANTITFFNSFYLLVVSTLVGIWVQKRRSKLFAKGFSFAPIGAILFICLAVITFSTIAYAHGTWNSSVIDFFSDFIIYSHLAFGAAFFLYAFFNFTPPLMKNIDVSEYMFEAKDIKYMGVKALGILMLIALFYIKSLAIFNTFMAGQNNYKGDVAYLLEDELMADFYFQRGALLDSYNSKSNFPLAELYTKKKKFQFAQMHMENVIFSTPHPIFYSAYQRIIESNNEAFKNIWKLEEGLKLFPNDGRLINNLAATYNREGIKADTCLYLYEKALSLLDEKALVQSNMVSYCAKNNLYAEADSLMNLLDLESDVVLEANKYAILNALQKPYSRPKTNEFFDSPNLYNATSSYLYNATFRELPSSPEIMDKVKRFQQNANNEYYMDYLTFLESIQLFYKGDHIKAKELFDQLLIDCPTAMYPYYTDIFGLLMFKINADDIAREYFRKSHQSQQFYKINKAPLHYAFSSISSLTPDSLATLFRSIATHDSSYSAYAHEFANNIENKDLKYISTLPDYQKIQYLQVHQDDSNLEPLFSLIQVIEEPNLKTLACSFIMHSLLNRHDLASAQYVYGLAPGEIRNRFAASALHVAFLHLLFVGESYDQLLEERGKLDFVDQDQTMASYYEIKTLIATRKLDTAEEKINNMMRISPLFTEGIILRADFYNTYKKEGEKAYNQLQQALLIDPTSIRLKQAFALQCLDLNMSTFAEETLADIESGMPKNQFKEFLKKYLQQKIIAEERFNNW